MARLHFRPMTDTEYEAWQTQLASAYAAEQVKAGRWIEEGSVARARLLTEKFLPEGLQTKGMIIIHGVDDEGVAVGRAWAGVDHPRGTPATGFLYDIEVIEDRRGNGYGAQLLQAVEEALRAAGNTAMELNVFGDNAGAMSLYGNAGFAVASRQMRKTFEPE